MKERHYGLLQGCGRRARCSRQGAQEDVLSQLNEFSEAFCCKCLPIRSGVPKKYRCTCGAPRSTRGIRSRVSRELLDLTVERVGSLPVLGAALRSHHYRKKDSADSSLPPSGHAAVERAEHKMLHTVRV